ncbi:hypothetical protein N7462_004387 [Penicillium macrosclerotiorum]|uniref:uncharacterized protein n=1 Tax=Penicillium macrosclerotiorum TaxID=303699 RepID=UPI0025473882|nr:uncharacterized protein N7462_004387 [Penicillium macrosclerotiorum]KAJ5689995.1 hypothetical protein N7462_004387 [Penicillium macrosclerotiorum]
MAAFWLYLGYWDLFAFLVGLLLAERRIMSEMAEGDGELCLPAESTKPPRTIIRAWKNITKSTIFDLIRTSAFLLLGLYFICIDAYSVLPPGYQFLQSIQSPYWHDTLTANECWETIGAVLVIFAISQSNYLQYPLNSRPIQYLGKISFSLYLVHPSVYFMLLQPIRDLVWFLISQKPYPGTVEAIYYTLPFWSAWTASFLITAGVIIVIAHFFTRFIDEKSVIIARSIEKKISVL